MAEPTAESDALVREAYRLGYEDRSKERDYDPGHALDLLTSPPEQTTGESAAPDFAWCSVRWGRDHSCANTDPAHTEHACCCGAVPPEPIEEADDAR